MPAPAKKSRTTGCTAAAFDAPLMLPDAAVNPSDFSVIEEAFECDLRAEVYRHAAA